MTETKFTPGPWRYDGDETAYYDLPTLNIRGKNGDIVAGAVDYIGGPGLPNTNLIAAAPELYEALGDLVSSIGCLDIDLSVLHEEIKIARAALSKARGEA